MINKKLEITLPQEFIDLCERDGVKPEAIIKGFIGDLCGIINWAHPDPSQGRMPRPKDGYSSHGSDERRMAQEYFDRVGYGFGRG